MSKTYRNCLAISDRTSYKTKEQRDSMSDDDTKYTLEAHLKECELRYRMFEEKLDNLNEHQQRINKHTFELRQMMTWFMGAAASFAAISVLLGVIYLIKEII